ncbi:MAG: hypothetical protein Kow0080_27980 [Candidatus Promineifilaceae bacterium]
MIESHHQPIWQAARPYLQTRSNDTHTFYCYGFARQLLAVHTNARADIVLTAVLLHDVGWSTVPEDKQLLSFGPHMRYPELRRQHEVEGARIAREILTGLAVDTAVIEAAAAIIDGHDTRPEILSLEDALVKDADKLWRYTPFGLETVGGWFGFSPEEQLALLEKWLEHRFYTDTAVHMARGLLAYLQIRMADMTA